MNQTLFYDAYFNIAFFHGYPVGIANNVCSQHDWLSFLLPLTILIHSSTFGVFRQFNSTVCAAVTAYRCPSVSIPVTYSPANPADIFDWAASCVWQQIFQYPFSPRLFCSPWDLYQFHKFWKKSTKFQFCVGLKIEEIRNRILKFFGKM